jgi:tetratricopeptide (TPR) repeat protein
MYTSGNFDGAQTILLNAEDRKPGNPQLQLEEAALKEEIGDLEGAAHLYSLAASSKGQADLQIDEASCLARSGHWDEAVQILASFLESPPGHPDALWELALAHRSLAKRGGWNGRSAKAEWRLERQCLEALVAQRPDMSAAQMMLGECAETLGDGEAAVVAYEAALSLEPSYRKLNARVARLLRRMGERAKALDWYEKATAVEPDNEALRNEKAILLKKMPHLVKERSAERMRLWEAVTPPTQTAMPPSSILVRVGLATPLSRIVFRGGASFDAGGESRARFGGQLRLCGGLVGGRPRCHFG